MSSNQTLVQYENKKFTCKSCPYGAVCDGSLRSLPNYWGHTQGDQIVMKKCPSSNECCSREPCSGFNECSENKQGLLCFECKTNFTHDLFTNACVPNKDCGQWCFWPSALVVIVAWSLIILFRNDIWKCIIIGIGILDDKQSYFQLFVNFSQDLNLLCIERQIITKGSVILNLFSFQLLVLNVSNHVCVKSNFDTIRNTLVKSMTGPII